MEEKTFDMFLVSIVEVQTHLYYETYSDLVLFFQMFQILKIIRNHIVTAMLYMSCKSSIAGV